MRTPARLCRWPQSCSGTGTTPRLSIGRKDHMFPPRCLVAGTLVVVLTIVPALASAAEPAPAGRIKLASGKVFVVRANAVVPAVAGPGPFQAANPPPGPHGPLGLTRNADTPVCPR